MGGEALGAALHEPAQRRSVARAGTAPPHARAQARLGLAVTRGLRLRG
jgi:hypothetical protein